VTVGDDPLLGHIPTGPVAVPPTVRRALARLERADNALTPVWRNQLGGLTFGLGPAPFGRYLKWAPAGTDLDLAAEAARLRWAAPRTPVPRVLGEGGDCPFSWSSADRVAEARRRLAAGIAPPDWIEDPAGLLADPPDPEPVVCHGDPCAPNTLLGDDGRWSAHVDLASLGVGDRWADLAVASWSLEWNYGPGWDDTFHAAYGIEADPHRIRWYRALWVLT